MYMYIYIYVCVYPKSTIHTIAGRIPHLASHAISAKARLSSNIEVPSTDTAPGDWGKHRVKKSLKHVDLLANIVT